MNDTILNAVSGSKGTTVAPLNESLGSAEQKLHKEFEVKSDLKCQHERLELYVKPCLKCNAFCNCRYTYRPKFYPDVLVRSLDKHIVQISGNLVRASATLSIIVDKFAGTRNATPLEEESVMIERQVNNSNYVTQYMAVEGVNEHTKPKNKDDNGDITTINTGTSKGTEITTGNKSFPTVPPALTNFRIRNSATKMKFYRKERLENETNSKWKDLIENGTREKKVLALFDLESDQPTFGVTRDILKKLDYYINMHLKDVDMRVQAKKRSQFFKETFQYKDSIPSELLEELEIRNVNTFQYEDWEEKFFDVNPGTLFDFHKANQELLIWDLYYAIEKWMVLFRGYPKLMVNGKYDVLSDPDNVMDKCNFFGLYGIPYPNPYRKSWHSKTRLNISHFNRVELKPRWWCVSYAA